MDIMCPIGNYNHLGFLFILAGGVRQQSWTLLQCPRDVSLLCDAFV